MFLPPQNIAVFSYNKIHHGEVITPYSLIRQIISLLPSPLFQNPNLRWLDPCAGNGYFSMILYQHLFISLQASLPNEKKRRQHIISNMIYMIEINPLHIPRLYSFFGENVNIIMGDFLAFNNLQFDVILGNPPFTHHGVIKTPTMHQRQKKHDGKACWAAFVRHSIQNLMPHGYLAMIVPSIWMKRDHAFHSYMLQWQILYLHCLSSIETNRRFHGRAQTPTCFFALQKVVPSAPLLLHDSIIDQYIPYSADPSASFPVYAPRIILKLRSFVTTYGYIEVFKTSMRLGYKGLRLSPIPTTDCPYPNVSTCKLQGNQPTCVVQYSNIPCSYAGQPKLILAHKMYGFPYLDLSGQYGISNRDNYVLLHRSPEEMQKLQAFLSTKLALLVFKAARYRMQYLEKYAFEYLPDITKIPAFPQEINDENMADFFQFSPIEKEAISTIVKKPYSICK